jgi:allantoinase
LPRFDLLVRGGTVVTPDGTRPGDVGVSDGLVEEVGPDLEGTARETIDAAGLHVFPGAVDAHVHCNDPGRSDSEGFDHGTRALAAGGTTTFVDMPLNASPPTVDAASFDLKVEAAAGIAQIDFALWGGLIPGNVDRLDELAERGVVGFKAFMCDTGLVDFPMADDETLRAGMERAARLGLPVAVHAENAELTTKLAAQAVSAGRVSMRDYLASRPAVAELEAIERAIGIAGETGCALHVVHVSTGSGVQLVTAARARGVDVTCETCPHYLALDEEDAVALGMVAKCSPPLRPRQDVDDLWRAVLDGHVDTVASDHSPSSPAAKQGDDAFAAWGGIAGCQTLLRVLLTEGPPRGLTLEAVVRLAAAGPARRFRLEGKGSLAPGAAADIVLVDVGDEAVLTRDELLSRHRLNPFVGRVLRGRVVRTILRGSTVWLGGVMVASPGGRLVRPHPGATTEARS